MITDELLVSYKKLWAGVMRQAYEDIHSKKYTRAMARLQAMEPPAEGQRHSREYGIAKSLFDKHRHDRDSAIAWVEYRQETPLNDAPMDISNSFESICHLLELNPEFTRKRILSNVHDA